MIRIEVVHKGADQLGETPLWCERLQKLWWLDIEKPKLQSWDPEAKQQASHAFETTFLGAQALTLNDRKRLVATGNLLQVFDLETGVLTPFATVENGDGTRLNDGRVDARGRLWIGTMDNALQRGVGSLYRVDPDGSVHRQFGDVVVANGIAFSPGNRTAYFTDTRRYRTWAFDFDLDDGKLSGRRLFADYSATRERPDGATVDADGCLWQAFFAGGRLVRYRPDGKIDREVRVPVTNPTCLCFGGSDFRTAFVTSAAKFLSAGQLADEPLAGALLAVEGMGQGLPEHRFAID